MKRASGIILLGVMMLAACSSKQVQKVEVEVPALRVSCITKDDSVLLFIQTTGEQNKELADQYTQKSKSLEDEFIHKAIWNAKRAITLHPTKKRYELAVSLMLKAKKYADAQELLRVLIIPGIRTKNAAGQNEEHYLFEKPTTDNYHDYIIASLIAQSGYLDNYCIYLAEDLGININDLKSGILKDELFTYREGTPDYENFLLNFATDAEIDSFSTDVRNFDKFISRIPDLREVFEVTQSALPKFDYQNYNGSNFEEGYTLTSLEAGFLAESKRDQNRWTRYNTIAKKHLNENVCLVLYSVDTSATACPIPMRHIYYHLVTYSASGEVIDSRIVAWQSGTTSATARFNGTEITVQEYNRTWKNDYNKYDFGNELLNTELSSQFKLKVTKEGNILTADLPVAL